MVNEARLCVQSLFVEAGDNFALQRRQLIAGGHPDTSKQELNHPVRQDDDDCAHVSDQTVHKKGALLPAPLFNSEGQ